MFSQVTGYCEGFSSNDLNLQMIGNVPQVWFNVQWFNYGSSMVQ